MTARTLIAKPKKNHSELLNEQPVRRVSVISVRYAFADVRLWYAHRAHALSMTSTFRRHLDSGYVEENHTFAPPQQTTTTNSSSQTETEYIFDQITTDDDLSWLPQLEDVDDLFARLVNGAE